MGTYSFNEVTATVTGPGGAVSIGYGAAVAEEGITIEPTEDKDVMTIGADGEVMHGLRAGNPASIVVRLQKTSPTNALLSAMYNLQTLSSANWGQNVILVRHNVSGDTSTGTAMAFRRHTGVTYAKDPNMNEWAFQGKVDRILGVY